MTAYSSKGVNVKIFDALEFGAPATTNKATITAVSAASPCVITYSGAKINNGDFVRISQRTGIADIDDKTFIASSTSTTSATLIGSNGTGAVAIPGPIDIMPVAASTAIDACLTGIDFATVTPNTISIATFCDPALTIDGPDARGQMTVTGHAAEANAGYKRLAQIDRHGKDKPITIAVELPDSQGWVFQTGIVSSIDFDLPLDGVVGFTATIETFGNADHRY